jgi:signal transduction histidine kinase
MVTAGNKIAGRKMKGPNSEQNWEQARALAAVHAAGREIASSLDLDRTLRLVMEKAVETLPMDAGAIFIRDEAAQVYRVVVSHNLPPDQIDQIKFGFAEEGVPGWAVKHRQPLIVDDSRLDERVHPVVRAAGILSVLAMPLISRERPLGALNLFSRQTHAFDEAALQLSQVFADQAAVFLDNARLMGELRQWAAELEQRVAKRTRQLEEKQAQIIQAEKTAAIGRLAASVAHEVNNPLQAIALHLQLLSEENLSAGGRQLLQVVEAEFGRIATIVGRLLDFQQPQADQKRPQQIGQILAAVFALTERQLARAAVELQADIAADLPPVAAVGDQLKQVFLNLILNGMEAMPDGGMLAVTAFRQGDAVCIQFRDHGEGVPPALLERLFEPFVTTKPGGTGLGLAVTREIILNHGGDLRVVNEPAGGANFTVTLPIDEAA